MIHKGANFYYGIIPSNHVVTEKISYYILLELDNNQLYSFPYQNPTSGPIEIKINHNNSNNKMIMTMIMTRIISRTRLMQKNVK